MGNSLFVAVLKPLDKLLEKMTCLRFSQFSALINEIDELTTVINFLNNEVYLFTRIILVLLVQSISFINMLNDMFVVKLNYLRNLVYVL